MVAQASAIESGAANAKLDFVALARDVNIARIDLVAAGVVVGRLLPAEPAGLLEFPSHGHSPSLRPTPFRRTSAYTTDPSFDPAAAAARRTTQASPQGAAAVPSSPAPPRPPKAQ